MQTAVQQTLDIPLRWTDLIAINSAPKSGLDAAVTNFKRVLVNADRQALKNNREKIDLRDQDLIYSIGLIDYFNDDFVVKLLNYIHGALATGGKVILGNFHPRNPDKALMDHVFDWRLIHRTEADMDRLFRASAFQRDCTNVRFEEQGINLSADCVKQ